MKTNRHKQIHRLICITLYLDEIRWDFIKPQAGNSYVTGAKGQASVKYKYIQEIRNIENEYKTQNGYFDTQ